MYVFNCRVERTVILYADKNVPIDCNAAAAKKKCYKILFYFSEKTR